MKLQQCQCLMGGVCPRQSVWDRGAVAKKCSDKGASEETVASRRLQVSGFGIGRKGGKPERPRLPVLTLVSPPVDRSGKPKIRLRQARVGYNGWAKTSFGAYLAGFAKPLRQEAGLSAGSVRLGLRHRHAHTSGEPRVFTSANASRVTPAT
jgi:hypothetical protein